MNAGAATKNPILNRRVIWSVISLCLAFGCNYVVGAETLAVSPQVPMAYEDALAAALEERDALSRQYSRAEGESTRTAVLQEAAQVFARVVDTSIFPFWYGTPWDFNGTTEEPGKGAIACGYFVTTVLRDMGIDLDRVLLAQGPSETLIRSLVGSDAIQRYSDVPIADFVEAIRDWGEGLYIVGLDIHVGFIVHDGDKTYFVHSSYQEPLCVVREAAIDSAILTGSRYRVLGKLTGDHAFLIRWLNCSS